MINIVAENNPVGKKLPAELRGGVLRSSITLFLVFTQGALLVALIVPGGLGIGVVWTNTDAISE